MNSSVLSSKQSFSYDKNASDSKSSLREAFPFRGFPESEISTTYNHTKNVNNLCKVTEYDSPRSETLANVNPNSASYVKQQVDPSLNCQSNNIPNEWLNKDSKHQMSSRRQYLFNKKYNVPAKGSAASASYIPHPSSQAVNQNARSSMKIYDDAEVKANCLQNKMSQQLNDVEYESKHRKDSTCAFDKDKKSDISYMIIDIGQDATIKQKIKNDTHKMDVHWDEDQNVVVDADNLLAPVRDKLKRSISNFLKRAEEGVSLELPAFPRTRSYPQINSWNSTHFTSKDRKSETPHKVLGKDFTSRSSDNSLLLKCQNADVNLGKNKRAPAKETKQGAFACVGKLQNTKYSSRKSNEVSKLQAQRDDSDRITEKKVATVEREERDTEKSIYGCKITGATNDVNPEDNFQTHSIFQLAAHKKRYYNTLLNVQKAKVAVTNSLASSSNHLTGYDPYYSNHTCQQQKHLFRQQCHLAAEPQFSACSTLSGLSNVNSNQYSWAKSDCKYLLLKQLKLERQNLPVYARNQDDWIHRYIGSAHPYSFIPSGNDSTRHCARHKTLEDIVGKLKETEHSNVNN